MTASSTPRLALMQPANSDNFQVSDFDDTFTKLDGRPGVVPVANYAALPAGLTTAQHGNMYLLMDTMSIWAWSKPGSPAGTWKKVNSSGVVGSFAQGALVSTATTVPASGVNIIAPQNITCPGGRPMLAVFRHNAVRNSGTYGVSEVNFWVNGSIVAHCVGGSASNHSNSFFNDWMIDPQAPGTVITVRATLNATAIGGGTSSTTTAEGHLWVFEV